MRHLFIFFGISLYLISCCGATEEYQSKESVLNDIELADPFVISINVNVDKILDEKNMPSNQIKVSITDKHALYVSLRKGNVMINGNLMKYSNEGYYTIDPSVLNVEGNKKYDITIELADGKKYSAYVKTPPDFGEVFGEINVPAEVNLNSNMNITWENKSITGDYKIGVEIGGVESFTQSLPDSSKENATFSIPASAFNTDNSSLKEGVVVFSVLSNGEVDKSFRSGSSIRSKFEIRKRFRLQ